jgi:hypothetical protein
VIARECPLTVAAIWENYRAAVIHPGAPDAQVKQTQMAFYAGAASMWDLMVRVSSDGPDVTDEDMAAMTAFHDELLAFVDGFKCEEQA